MVIQIPNSNFLFLVFLFCFSLASVLGDYDCEYKKDGFYSDEDFCHIYWRCNYGVAEEYECPAGTAWNHIEMRCDWLDNVDCSRIDANEKDADKSEETTKKRRKKTTTAADDDYEDTTTPSEDEKLATTAPNNLKNTTLADDDYEEEEEDDGFDFNQLCINATADDAFRDDPFICNRYVRCNFGSAQKFVCTKATAWDSIKKMCTWISEVNCGERQLVLDDKLLDEDNKNSTKTTKTTKKKIKTTKLTKKTSPSTSLPITKNPNDLIEKPEELKPTSTICINPGVYNAQDNSDCSSYFMCNNGKETKMTCTDKQYFNSETNQCEDWQQVGCGTRPASLNADKSQCTGKRDGIYPDNERACRVFYQCVNQMKTREAVCPNNLKFNSVSAKCDNPSNILAPCGTFTAAGAHKLIFNYKFLITGLIVIAKTIFL